MNSIIRGFSDLKGGENQYPQRWHDARQEVIEFIQPFDENTIFKQITTILSLCLDETGELPPYEEIKKIIDNLPSLCGFSEASIKNFDPVLFRAVIMSGSFRQILKERDPSSKLLQAISRPDYLDIPFIVGYIVGSTSAETWRSFLSKISFSVLSINDDEYMADDEINRWKIELKKPVPSWRSGDWPHRDMGHLQLASELLRALDEDAWIDFMDKLPLPSIMEVLLYSTHVDYHPETILRWLAKAPKAFDEEGKRTESSLVFILEHKAFQLIERDLLQQCPFGKEKEFGDQKVADGNRIREELASAIKSREDGDELLAELGSNYMVWAQQDNLTTARGRMHRELHYRLGLEYAKALGDSKEVLSYLKKRGTTDTRSRWGLWLAACARAADSEDDSSPNGIIPEYWEWLKDILLNSDKGPADPYSVPASWAQDLSGFALVSSSNSQKCLEEVWEKLAEQRSNPHKDDYSRDSWSTSRFLIRTGFYAYKHEDDRDIAVNLWHTSMKMALSAWLLDRNLDPIAEVILGLGLLAIKKEVIGDEPSSTLEYMVGLPQELIRTVHTLLHNGMPPETIIEATNKIGIDVGVYLELIQDKRIKKTAHLVKEKLASVLGKQLQESESSVPAKSP